MAYYAYLEEDTCYVCLEECSHKSPCTCQAHVHKTCLDVVQIYHGEICTICKSRFPPDPDSKDSADLEDLEGLDSDLDSLDGKWKHMLCYILFIVGFFTYIVVNFVVPY